ncbi:MAG TPA: hypothetical protein VGI86_15435 [Acidimicrobiia bacterium]|jgi:hypothetical protein
MTHSTFGRIALGAIAGLFVMTLAACGGSSKAAPSAQSNSPSATAPGGSPATKAGSGATTTPSDGSSTGHLGDTLTHPSQYDKSDIETVTLSKIVDPATAAAAGTTPDPGSRFVGLIMSISDSGIDSTDAQDQALATGSDGKVYEINADIEGNFVGCTSKLSDLPPNHKATFCPAFLLPNGVKITKVGYSLHGSEASVPPEVTWTVP